MRLRIAVAALVNSVFVNEQANTATGARRINTGILFTNSKSRSIHSESVPRNSESVPRNFESVPRSRSKANRYSYAKKGNVIIFIAPAAIICSHIY